MDRQDKRKQINGIENFWNQAKRVLWKYNGIPRQHFYLFIFIKECEFRFNYGTPGQQLKTLKHWLKQEGVLWLSGKAPIFLNPL